MICFHFDLTAQNIESPTANTRSRLNGKSSKEQKQLKMYFIKLFSTRGRLRIVILLELMH